MNSVPLLRFGVMTDNHLAPEHPELAGRTLAAFKLLNRLGTDLVIDCGDISDTWQPEELKHFYRMFMEAFAGKIPQRLWILAGHDVLRHPDYMDAYPEAALCIDVKEMVPMCCVNGFYFVGVFQCGDYQEFERKLQMAVNASGCRPVFAVTHEPAADTVLHSDYNGDRELLQIFERYPQVIQISGHTHDPISHDRSIWQGKFTAFNAGSLTYWKDLTFGRESRRHQSCDVLFCELYSDRLIVQRLNAMTGEKQAPDWIIPLPFDPQTAPYRPERRKKELTVPMFQHKASLHFSGEGFGKLTVRHAVPHSSVLRYRVTLFEGEKELSVMDFYPGTWENAAGKEEEDFFFPPGMVEYGHHYHCTVVPLNHFDCGTDAAELEFTASGIFLEELPVQGISGVRAGEKTLPVSADGCFETDGTYPHGYKIGLPEKLTGYYDSPVVMVFDFSCEHAGRPAVLMACGEKPDYGRHYFPSGKEKEHRHCFDLSDLKGKDRYILLCEGEAGNYHIGNVRYFTYSKNKGGN